MKRENLNLFEFVERKCVAFFEEYKGASKKNNVLMFDKILLFNTKHKKMQNTFLNPKQIAFISQQETYSNETQITSHEKPDQTQQNYRTKKAISETK